LFPPTLTRELRDLTRYRVNLVQECNRIANRIQKVLEDANIKLAAVASDSLGASGRAMLKAIIQGEQDAEKLSEMSKGTLRNKRDQLKLAMEGRITAHHRFLLKELFDHLEFVEGKIERLEAEISQRMHPFEEKVQHLRTIPGIDRITAWSLLAEIGMDMSRFPDAAHLASWAGLCPGNHESAGKRMSGKTRKGSVWLTRHLCQAAWAVSTKKNSYLSAMFRRLAARRGVKRAIIAIAHTILVIVFHMLKRGIDYRDLGPNYFDRLNAEQVKRNLVKRLENLGLRVTLDTRTQEA
jgi:transposase